MDLRLWDPFTAVARLDHEFDDLVRRTWGQPSTRRVAGFVPAVELVLEGSDAVVRVELPGIDPERDVDVTVHDGRLVISGERRDERSDTGRGVVVRELRYGSFRREFALPEGVGPEAVEAAYDAGMLTVRVRGVTKPAPEPVKVPVTRSADTEERKVIEAES